MWQIFNHFHGKKTKNATMLLKNTPTSSDTKKSGHFWAVPTFNRLFFLVMDPNVFISLLGIALGCKQSTEIKNHGCKTWLVDFFKKSKISQNVANRTSFRPERSKKCNETRTHWTPIRNNNFLVIYERYWCMAQAFTQITILWAHNETCVHQQNRLLGYVGTKWLFFCNSEAYFFNHLKGACTQNSP